MIRRVIASGLLATSLLASAYAQQKPNFTGSWKLNVAKSDFGEDPAPKSRTDVITHKDPSLTDQVSIEGAKGTQEYTAVYTTDGKEVVNKQGARELHSIFHWDGGKLVNDSTLHVNDEDIIIKQIWILSADGNTITQKVHYDTPEGESDHTLVYEKH